ncbi:MAG: TonB-dependent receptor [Flavobacteriales bacterium]|nr:TonB-dependent receptor [Flavobacteriales bacterium]
MNTTIRLSALVFALFLSPFLFAQDPGELHGKVTLADGSGIYGAVVTADDGIQLRGAQTDEGGRFKIKPLPAGRYTVKASMIGLEDRIFEGILVNVGEISKLEIVMYEEDVVGPGAVVEGTIDPLIRVDGGTQIVLRYDDLKNMSSFKGGGIKGGIRAMTSDIKSDSRGTELYFRGSRNGSTLFFIDGMKIRENVPNVPSSALSSITVYTGGLPAKYGDCTGGVVVIQTKSYTEDYYRKQAQ